MKNILHMNDTNEKCIFDSCAVSINNGNLNLPSYLLFGFLLFSMTTLLQLL